MSRRPIHCAHDAIRHFDSEISWLAVPQAFSDQVLGMPFQLERTQWYSAEELWARQFEQLAQVARHAD